MYYRRTEGQEEIGVLIAAVSRLRPHMYGVTRDCAGSQRGIDLNLSVAAACILRALEAAEIGTSLASVILVSGNHAPNMPHGLVLSTTRTLTRITPRSVARHLTLHVFVQP